MKVSLPALGLLVGLVVGGCATTTSQQVRPHQPATPPVETQVDLTVYAPPPTPPDINTMVRISQYPAAHGAAIATIRANQVTVPSFDGVCLNAEAQATIESDINSATHDAEIRTRTQLALLGVTAVRDINLLRNDTSLQRAFYEAQIRDRDDQVTNANTIIRNLESSAGTGTMNVLRTIGWIGAGIVVGVAASGVYLLLTH